MINQYKLSDDNNDTIILSPTKKCIIGSWITLENYWKIIDKGYKYRRNTI